MTRPAFVVEAKSKDGVIVMTHLDLHVHGGKQCYDSVFNIFSVCREWLVREDEVVAHRLQDEECK